MSLKSKIVGDNNVSVTVDDIDNSLLVSAVPYPPIIEQRVIPFRQFLTQDGTAAGTSSMLVDGSVTNVDYYVQAHSTRDRYITTLSFLIADASASLNKFGNITALTNGCSLFYERQGTEVSGAINIHNALKTNFDFVRLGFGNPTFGDAGTVFRINNAVGASEGYIPILDLRTIMPPYGIKLDLGTTQKLVLRIRDDVSTIDGFDCIAYGFDRF